MKVFTSLKIGSIKGIVDYEGERIGGKILIDGLEFSFSKAPERNGS